MRVRSWGPAVATVAMTATLLTGCGGGDDGGDFTDQSAKKIADAAKKSMNELEAVTIEGTLTSEGQEIEISMEIGEGGNCTGEFSTQGATAEILGVDGATWFRPDEAFWTLQAGPDDGPVIAEAAGDRWVALPEGDTSFSQFCDLEEFLDSLTDQADATYTKGETKDVNGDETIEIISDRPDEGKSSGYVQTGGEHYLVLIEKTEGDEPGTVNFSGFDEQPDVEEPGADEQVTLEELQNAG